MKTVCLTCFYNLRQIPRAGSMLTRVSICIRVHYDNAIHAPLSLSNQLRSVLNSVAPLIGGISRFGHNVSVYMRDKLQCLSLLRRIEFKILMMMRHMRGCLAGLLASCTLKSYVASVIITWPQMSSLCNTG